MKKLDKDLITEVSLELGIDKSFVEKDYYVVEILKILSLFSSEEVKVEFSGGTSLSKGFKLIKRFSEDIDFTVQVPENWKRADLHNLREKIIDSINREEILSVEKNSVTARDGNKFFSFYVNYPKIFDNDSLRPQVKVEVCVKPIKKLPVRKIIFSWINEYIGENSPAEIDCVCALEIAANKFSALLWRIDCKDRSSSNHTKNDPAMIRHLYDLYFLKDIIAESISSFYQLVCKIFENDRKRGGDVENMSLKEFAVSSLKKLENDSVYKDEYDKFVASMVYEDDDIVSYETACVNFKSLVFGIEI
ncbi:nucleotidyl transferase AbiEii/AbiGii toxin family protein [uncultured Treponema sp.]|uniref:nucleotidyl transferase AbiEii/AbiGii toxin family protein n=1 Tax=uncultured Treponema sp. TaxID=162155 RepID=UPI00262303FB|nr:nucleotidyl transferase AbiEii/AbiGii toxin family protein [uncultured Treponema sp.]